MMYWLWWFTGHLIEWQAVAMLTNGCTGSEIRALAAMMRASPEWVEL